MRFFCEKKVCEGGSSAVGRIDLAGLEALYEVVGFDVYQLHRCRLVEYAIGDALAHGNMRDPGDLVVKALEMLHVYGGEHVDASA